MYSSFLIVIFLILGILETFSYPNNVNAENDNEEDYNIVIERRGRKLLGNLYFDCKTLNIDAGKLFIGDQKDLNLNSLRKRCYGLKQDDENQKCLEYMKNKPPDHPKCPLIQSTTESNSIDHQPLPETTTREEPRPMTTKKPQPLTTTTKRPGPTTTKESKPTSSDFDGIDYLLTTRKPKPASSEFDEIDYVLTTRKPKPASSESDGIKYLPLPKTTTRINRPTTRKKRKHWTTTTTIPRPTNTKKSEPSSSESDEIEYLPLPETTKTPKPRPTTARTPEPRPTTTTSSQLPCTVPSPGTPCYTPCCASQPTIIVTVNNSTGTVNLPGATLNDIKNYYAGRKLGTKYYRISTTASNVHDVNKSK